MNLPTLLKPNNIKTLFQTKTKKTFFKIIIKHIYIYIYTLNFLFEEKLRERKSPLTQPSFTNLTNKCMHEPNPERNPNLEASLD